MPTILTLVGVKQANIGEAFLHCGPVENCQECKLVKVCQKLEPGRVYEVMKVREVVHECVVHEGGVALVEVREASIPAAIDLKSCVVGALITYSPQRCEEADCKEKNNCNPLGIRDGEKCRIEEVVKRIGDGCQSGRQLAVCRLRRAATA